MLKDRNIIVGVTGGIAAYKMCTVVRLLKKAGASVRVLMTQSATQFVTPLTFSTLSQEEVVVSMWPEDTHTSTSLGVRHINLGLWAHAMVIAPATANTIARLAHGQADDIIASTALALRAPLLIAPAMDVDMFRHSATQTNLATLQLRGVRILPPDEGELASGLTGPGRLPDPEVIVKAVEELVDKSPRDFSGKKILVTAGPTYEPIDPVRFIGNRSSGKMGFALAAAAAQRGAEVTLIAGPVLLPTPLQVKRIDVGTAAEMRDAVLRAIPGQDVLIMAAAVADFTPAEPAPSKIKKGASEGMTLKLKGTADILAESAAVSNGALRVGFALETDDAVAHAKEKLRAKKLDLIVLNSLRDPGAGFGTDTNCVTMIGEDGKEEKLPLMSKFDVATGILNRVSRLL